MYRFLSSEAKGKTGSTVGLGGQILQERFIPCSGNWHTIHAFPGRCSRGYNVAFRPHSVPLRKHNLDGTACWFMHGDGDFLVWTEMLNPE